MMLGWGLRGFIGGGPLGAMIPGAMVALCLCLTRQLSPSARLCAFGAIAISFGGEMTYGQTVGASIAIETRWWGLLGLALKGAIWGLLGGAVFSLGLTRISSALMAQVGVVAGVATWIGWRFINHPKLIYFSNRLDRPREEVWAGFLLAAIALLLWLGRRQPHLVRFSLWGGVGGWFGFGLGGALQAYGIDLFGRQHPWWKGMEFTFGFLFGLALAKAAERLPASSEPNPPAAPLWQQLLAGLVFTSLLFRDTHLFQLRFDALLLGMFCLLIVTWFPWSAWQLGLTVTVGATCFDLARVKPQDWQYYAAGVASLLFGLAVARYVHHATQGLLWLTWSTTAIATAKFIVQGSGPENIVCIALILMAIAVTMMVRRLAPNAP